MPVSMYGASETYGIPVTSSVYVVEAVDPHDKLVKSSGTRKQKRRKYFISFSYKYSHFYD